MLVCGLERLRCPAVCTPEPGLHTAMKMLNQCLEHTNSSDTMSLIPTIPTLYDLFVLRECGMMG
jgi:hypothetical protein